jgi:hypothetical protein
VAADPAREGKLLEELRHPSLILALVWVNLRVAALKVSWREDARCAVPGPRQEDGVQIILFDQPVQMDVSKAQPWTGAPVAEQPLFDVLQFQRFPQQWICAQIDHPRRQVIAGPPVGVDLVEFILGQSEWRRQVRFVDPCWFFILSYSFNRSHLYAFLLAVLIIDPD